MVVESFAGKNCLVTGGTGLIGRKVVDLLKQEGAKVQSVSLDDIRSDIHTIGDLCDFEFCQFMTEQQDFVFHCAGIKGSVKVSENSPATMFISPLQMNTNVLEACRINEVRGVVFVSSVGAYASAEVLREKNPEGEPMDEFAGWVKRTAEKQISVYHKQYKLKNYHIVRPTNVYGEGDNFDPDSAMVIPSLMAKIYRGDNPLIVWGDGSAIRDFAYSGDIGKGIVLAMRYGTGDSFVNLGGKAEFSIKQLVETLASFIKFKYTFDKTKPTGFPRRVMDNSLAKQLIGYEPEISLYDGLRRTWEWFVANPNAHLKKQNYFKEQECDGFMIER